jgi:Rieske Fe-S protein
MNEPVKATEEINAGRRGFFSRLSSIAMALGLTGSYGTFAALAGRYLFPARPPAKRWMYVARVADVRPGTTLQYQTPRGQTVAVTRLGGGETSEDFIALSNVCPHLGCRVHWQTQSSRFFCPCHNGAFDQEGRATEGPPFDARQNLARFPLMVEKGLLFMEVALETA